ncbi:MAG: hypothetical protein ACT6T0_15975 [Nevskia sp.]
MLIENLIGCCGLNVPVQFSLALPRSSGRSVSRYRATYFLWRKESKQRKQALGMPSDRDKQKRDPMPCASRVRRCPR